MKTRQGRGKKELLSLLVVVLLKSSFLLILLQTKVWEVSIIKNELALRVHPSWQGGVEQLLAELIELMETVTSIH